jgi:hypothetical protein
MRHLLVLSTLAAISACGEKDPEGDSTIETDTDTDTDSDSDSDADADADSDADTDPLGGWAGTFLLDAEAGGLTGACTGPMAGGVDGQNIAFQFDCAWDGELAEFMETPEDGSVSGVHADGQGSGNVDWGFLESQPWTGTVGDGTLEGTFSGTFTGGQHDVTYTGSFSAASE